MSSHSNTCYLFFQISELQFIINEDHHQSLLTTCVKTLPLVVLVDQHMYYQMPSPFEQHIRSQLALQVRSLDLHAKKVETTIRITCEEGGKKKPWCITTQAKVTIRTSTLKKFRVKILNLFCLGLGT